MHVHILQASWSIPVKTLQLWIAAWKKKEISLQRAKHLQPADMDPPGGLQTAIYWGDENRGVFGECTEEAQGKPRWGNFKAAN